METQPDKARNLLYLDEITLQNTLYREYTLKLFIENEEIKIQTNDNQTWTPVQRPEVSPTSKMRTEIQMRSGHLFWAKDRQATEPIDLEGIFDDYWGSDKHEFKVPKVVAVGKYRWPLELRFSANNTEESLRLSLRELEGLLKGYSSLISGPIEKAVEKAIQYGAIFAELNPIAKAAFGIANVTFELLKEQTKYDQMLLGLFDRLQRILSFADKVADEINTEILVGIIPQMFEVMYRVAKYSCHYVKLARTVGRLDYLETIEEMDRELTKVIEDFDRAVDVEALRLAKRSNLVVEQEFLHRRLKPVETGYHQTLCCMEGTRQSLLDRVIAWTTDNSEHKDGLQGNIYWVYGLPGIGKTSLAHSICARLHDRKQLAGAFFCRRGDSNLGDPRNIFLTLIYKLAEIIPSFHSIVANRLRDDPALTPESMKDSLFPFFIQSLPHHAKNSLVFIIDALDECGDDDSRLHLLKVLTGARSHALWLKIIITSRPEVDIQCFFDAPTHSSYLRYDLAEDKEATSDLRTFAKARFSKIASRRGLESPWPEQSLFNGVISRAAGLFIFIQTVAHALEQCEDEDPAEFLKTALQNVTGTGLTPLYGLYSNILKAQIVYSKAEFRRMIGVLLTTAPYRPLCEETIAKLAGVRPNFVNKCVDGLSSLLYRDKEANGEIRVRHLSVANFFVSDHCPSDYQVNLGDASVQLGISCLNTMIDQLHFNICKLEDSRLSNAEVQDLQSRIEHNIPDPLQYSSLYWTNHLCFTPDNGDPRVWESLKKFFEGLYPVFWIEVLSVMGMVPIGAPCLRRMLSWVKDADSTLSGRIQDMCHFIITFRTSVSISAPHTYISTQPFLPSQSPLSKKFGTWFTKTIKMQRGRLLSWPVPPLEWIGHTDAVNCTSYSPDGRRSVTGSDGRTIRIWDAKTGSVVGKPLEGHAGSVQSVAYSPDGQHH